MHVTLDTAVSLIEQDRSRWWVPGAFYEGQGRGEENREGRGERGMGDKEGEDSASFASSIYSIWERPWADICTRLY